MGNVDDNEREFLRQSKLEFDALVALQNGKGNVAEQEAWLDEEEINGAWKREATDCIVVEKLRAKSTCSSGMDGVGIGQLVIIYVKPFCAEFVARIASPWES